MTNSLISYLDYKLGLPLVGPERSRTLTPHLDAYRAWTCIEWSGAIRRARNIVVKALKTAFREQAEGAYVDPVEAGQRLSIARDHIGQAICRAIGGCNSGQVLLRLRSIPPEVWAGGAVAPQAWDHTRARAEAAVLRWTDPHSSREPTAPALLLAAALGLHDRNIMVLAGRTAVHTRLRIVDGIPQDESSLDEESALFLFDRRAAGADFSISPFTGIRTFTLSAHGGTPDVSVPKHGMLTSQWEDPSNPVFAEDAYSAIRFIFRACPFLVEAWPAMPEFRSTGGSFAGITAAQSNDMEDVLALMLALRVAHIAYSRLASSPDPFFTLNLLHHYGLIGEVETTFRAAEESERADTDSQLGRRLNSATDYTGRLFDVARWSNRCDHPAPLVPMGDYYAINMSATFDRLVELMSSVLPNGDPGALRGRSFEDEVQTAIEGVTEVPDSMKRCRRLQIKRQDNSFVTDIDAVAPIEGGALLVDAKSYRWSARYTHYDHAAVREVASKVARNADVWAGKVAELAATRRFKNCDFSGWGDLVPVVCVPQAPHLKWELATRLADEHLSIPLIVTPVELKNWLATRTTPAAFSDVYSWRTGRGAVQQ